MKLIQWLNEPVKDPCRRAHVLGMALIYLALLTLLFVLGEGMDK